MASEAKPEVLLFDLRCNKDVSFSPTVWRIRILLAYKGIPYTTKFLEFPDIAPTMKSLDIPPNTEGKPYTVPTIQYLPTGEYIMDSFKIAQFIDEKYPNPPLQIDPPERVEFEAIARKLMFQPLAKTLVPREPLILSEVSAKYFVDMMEPVLGPLKMLTPEEEEAEWKAAEPTLKEFADFLNRNPGPFVLGEKPSYPDMWLAGFLCCTRVIHEGDFQRLYKSSNAIKTVFDGCEPWMQKET